MKQFNIRSLSDDDAAAIERIRIERGLKSATAAILYAVRSTASRQYREPGIDEIAGQNVTIIEEKRGHTDELEGLSGAFPTGIKEHRKIDPPIPVTPSAELAEILQASTGVVCRHPQPARVGNKCVDCGSNWR